MDKFLARQTISKILPDFDGNPLDWPTFYAMYSSSTTACGYSKAENMARLMKCLKGAAKDAVRGMMMIPENLDEVMSTFEEMFGKSDHIIQSLIWKAKQTTSPRENQLGSIIVYANAVRNLVMTMQHLKATGHMWNPQLKSELINKLPDNLKIQWAMESARNKENNLKDFSDWLSTLSKSVNAITTSYYSEDKRKDDNKGKFVKSAVHATSDVKIKKKPNSESNCIFCNTENHSLENCKKFKEEPLQERWNFGTGKGLCFCCLKHGHRLEDCNEKKECDAKDCTKHHHKLLHNYDKKKVESKDEINVHTLHTKEVLLRILPVTVKGPRGEFKTYAMMDEASTGTYIDEEIAKKIGADGQVQPLKMSWFGGIKHADYESKSVTLNISGETGEEYELKNVHTRKNIALPVQTVDVKKLSQKWKHLKSVDVKSLKNAIPTILLGSDNYHLIMVREYREGPPNAPVLTRTKLGWLAHGTHVKGRIDDEFNLHVYENSFDQELHDMVKASFAAEDFGVKEIRKLRSTETERAEEVMLATTKRVENRWETGLLWKTNDEKLPESYNQALYRLKSMEKKMDKDANFSERYCNKIDEYVVKGYAKKLNAEEINKTSNKIWYLPHFGVINPNKPKKLRFVFDAACKSHGKSLNDVLLKGPDLLISLVKVLFGFREQKIPIGGDIKEMFHQVKIKKDDLESHRFLWRGKDRQRPPDIYQMQVMIFGAVSSPCSAQYVKNRNALEFEKEYPEAVNGIINKTYMDDYFDSVDTENEAIERIKQVYYIHKCGGFEMVNWVSNSQKVLDSIPEELRSIGEKKLEEMDSIGERVLGLKWNPLTDEFAFNVNFSKVDSKLLNGESIPTKRQVLRVIMSLYDPLGFLANFVVKAKILMQDIWISSIGWDDQLPANLMEKWKRWLNKLKTINQFSLPRSYHLQMSNTKVQSRQLHIFCGASERAFSAVAYLRIQTDENVIVSFVMARTRVTPTKTQSIPRSELQAAVLGSRLESTIKELHSIQINSMVFWSDSTTVLRWLRSELRQFKQFVGNRIGEILESTNLKSWRWIPTEENVSDEATRDTDDCDFTPNSRWIKGPDFLYQTEDAWPQETWNKSKVNDEDFELELKKHFTATITVSDNIMDVNKYSSWLRLIRITAWMLKFVRKCQKKLNQPWIEVSEMVKSQRIWWKLTQKESFPEEIEDLTNKKGISKSSRLKNLSVFMDYYGVLRMKSRLFHAKNLNEFVKCPVILDSRHPFTRLLIYQYHLWGKHQGQDYVVSQIQQKYWIIGLKNAVRNCWRNCQHCKNERAKPVNPEMGPIPECRLNAFSRPFTSTGIDFFRPYEIAIGRRREKRYGVIFTCMTTRAVHLELSCSISADSTIMAIRRFISRRGMPKEIISDNGTNFHGADNELKKALLELNHNQIADELSQHEIVWKFNVPGSPHMGGCWERLIRSVKTTLKVILKERNPKEEVLHTLMLEIESLLNGRPLTDVPIDSEDQDVLTPNHFLLGGASGPNIPGLFDDNDLFLRKQWKFAQQLTNLFWKRWMREYIPTLRKKTNWHEKTNNIKVGNIVLIVDDNSPRGTWPKGVIVAVYPGKDEKVRVVDVKTCTGTYRRHVNKICVLDVLKEDNSSLRVIQGEEILP